MVGQRLQIFCSWVLSRKTLWLLLITSPENNAAVWSETVNLTETILVATKAETKIIAGVADLTQKRKKDVNLSFNVSIVRSVSSSEIASNGPGNSCRCSDPKGFSFLIQRFIHFPSNGLCQNSLKTLNLTLSHSQKFGPLNIFLPPPWCYFYLLS